MKHPALSIPALLGVALLGGCRHAHELAPLPYANLENPSAASTAPPAAAPAAATDPVAAPVLTAMDSRVDPCQDFYRYACGGWMDRSEIPADRSRWGRGFSEIMERNLQVQRDVLESAARDAGGDADLARLGRFYGACMDEAAIERAGVKPIAPLLELAGSVDGPGALMTVSGRLHQAQVEPWFGLYVGADDKDSSRNIAHLFQGGLSLPDREYYLREDDDSKRLVADYQAHIARMMELAGDSPTAAAEVARAVVGLETELAKVSWPREELRDADKTYHKIDRDGLQKLTPGLPWGELLAGMGYPGVRDINVTTPSFFEGLDKVVGKAPVEQLRSYLRWQVVHDFAPQLGKALVDENFAFFGKRLSGQKELEARWKRCVRATDEALGEVLGKAFIERRFAGDSKQVALAMIQDIEAAFEQGLPELAWMDPVTRGRAVGKMKALHNKIGYPDKWRDYSGLELKAGDWLGNVLASRRFEFDYDAAKIGQPVDRGEWHMTPPTVNAYYNPSLNEMVFPAGILQPPFFDRSFPAAMNFGGIGMVMGHELTHGFDDQGRKYDADGLLRPWWEQPAVEKFEQSAKCVEDLYAGYEVLPGVKLNGKLTLGENIADLGGIKEAYRAYKLWERKNGAPASRVGGLSHDQLFFVAFAQTWCTLETPEIQKMLATVDPHSAPRFRVNGPLSNLREFAATFQCAPGTPMAPEKRCEVW